jgi:hypothetical protein
MRLGRSRRLRSVPKNTGTTAQSLAGAAPAPPGGPGTGATERVVGRADPSLSAPLTSSSLLAPTLGGTGGGAGKLTGGSGGDDAEGAGGDAEGAGGGDGAGAGGGDAGDAAGASDRFAVSDRFMVKARRLGSAPGGGGGGAEAVLGNGAIGRPLGVDKTGGAVSLAKIDRLKPTSELAAACAMPAARNRRHWLAFATPMPPRICSSALHA